LFGPITFSRNQTTLTAANSSLLDRVGQTLQEHPTLAVLIITAADKGEREGISDERATAIRSYLVSKWQLAQAKISTESITEPAKQAKLKLRIGGQD
jgi:outer membrane protein OmpA-like peptidoglycan-associated protein